jgi:hypothetical protein
MGLRHGTRKNTQGGFPSTTSKSADELAEQSAKVVIEWTLTASEAKPLNKDMLPSAMCASHLFPYLSRLTFRSTRAVR